MQEGATQVPQWLQLASSVLAGILSGVGIDRLYNGWLNRRKPAAEIHVTEATAAEIKIRASSNAGDAIMRFMDRLDTAQLTIDRLRKERDEERLRADKAEDDAKAAKMFQDQLHAAAKLTTCEHYPEGVRLSSFTPQQLNPSK